MSDNLSSLNLERTFLGGLVKNQDFFVEIDNIISEKDFVNSTHHTIFNILKQCYTSEQKVSVAVLAQKIIEIGIKWQNDIDIFSYLEDISFTQINAEGLKNTAQELVKLRVRRELVENAEEVKKFVIENGDKSVQDIITNVDIIYNNKINTYSTNDEPVDLYSQLESFIRKIAVHPVDECGLITPFGQFNKYFGGLKCGDGAYVFVGRSGEGKSAFLFNLSKGISLLNNCKILYLDTEMSLDLNSIRTGAMEADINEYYLRTGNWVKNPDLINKVSRSFEEMKKYNRLFYHKYVPNKDINEIITIIRKFYYKYVGRGEKLLVVYDYLKITSNFDKDRQEWQRLGD